MDEPVQPVTGRPIFTRSSQRYRLTTVNVLPNATTPDGDAFDIVFLGTG